MTQPIHASTGLPPFDAYSHGLAVRRLVHRATIERVEDALARLTTHGGGTVAMVAPTHAIGRVAFTEASRVVLDQVEDASVRVGTGAERIEWPNGSRLLLLSAHPIARGAMRGLSLDAIVPVGGLNPYALDWQEWAPLFVSSKWAGVE